MVGFVTWLIGSVKKARRSSGLMGQPRAEKQIAPSQLEQAIGPDVLETLT